MTTMEFTVSGKPRGKQRPRVTRHGSFTPKETQKYEAAVRAAFYAARWEAEREKGIIFDLTKITRVSVHFLAYFPVPESWTKAKKKSAYGQPYTSKPDLDNIAKIILDALNGVAFPDDAMVTSTSAKKCYCYEGESPRVTVTLLWEE